MRLRDMFRGDKDSQYMKTIDAGEFKESEHPRDPDGKFGSGGGGGASKASEGGAKKGEAESKSSSSKSGEGAKSSSSEREKADHPKNPDSHIAPPRLLNSVVKASEEGKNPNDTFIAMAKEEGVDTQEYAYKLRSAVNTLKERHGVKLNSAKISRALGFNIADYSEEFEKEVKERINRNYEKAEKEQAPLREKWKKIRGEGKKE